MKRRHFITLLGGAAAWPLATRAQQAAMPVIGFLRSSPEDGFGHLVTGFRQGLGENGYVEGRNVRIEYRFADDRPERLPALAADLVRREVSVLVTNYGAAPVVMAATKTIPIVFASGEDPVTGGLVPSLGRPGSNVTGVSFFDVPLAGKRLEILRELLPNVSRIALLLDTTFRAAEAERHELTQAAGDLGRDVVVINPDSRGEFAGAFAKIGQSGAGALLVGSGPLFNRERRQLVALAARHAIPAIYPLREPVDAGGLMSYGASQTDAYRRAGIYAARVLKGEKPADLPIELPTKFDLVINLKAARTLGLDIPTTLIARADEVIE